MSKIVRKVPFYKDDVTPFATLLSDLDAGAQEGDEPDRRSFALPASVILKAALIDSPLVTKN